MPKRRNSASYLAVYTQRLSQVLELIRLAQDNESPFVKYGGYLMAKNLELSMHEKRPFVKIPDVTPDTGKNEKAREKECDQKGYYRLRPEFSKPLQLIVKEADDLLDADDLTTEERLFTVMFMGLCGQIKTGELTFDRGHENAQHHELGVPTYFCNAYHSWEKGSIENANKMIRAFFPKKTDFTSVSQEQIDRIVSIINDKPRKILHYQTAREVARAGGVMHGVS